MRRAALPLAAGLVLLAAAAPEPAAYVCIPDSATGYRFGDGEWTPYQFKAPTEKYVIRRLSMAERRRHEAGGLRRDDRWGVYETGKSWAWAGCPDEPGRAGHLACSGHAIVDFSRDTLRFQFYLPGQYVSPASPEGAGDTPAIQLGRCTPL